MGGTTTPRDHAAADRYLVREAAAISDLAGGNDDRLRTLLRSAFLQGWHEAMNARDEDAPPRSCHWCGEAMEPDDEWESGGREPDADGVFRATQQEAEESDPHSRYWLPAAGWYYVAEEPQEAVGPFRTRDEALAAKGTGGEPEVEA